MQDFFWTNRIIFHPNDRFKELKLYFAIKYKKHK